MRSIIQENKEECYLCGGRATEEHHVLKGTANRKLSEKYGLKVYLCHVCHRTGKHAVHNDRETDLRLIRTAQKIFEIQVGSREDFIRIFGKSYILD